MVSTQKTIPLREVQTLQGDRFANDVLTVPCHVLTESPGPDILNGIRGGDFANGPTQRTKEEGGGLHVL